METMAEILSPSPCAAISFLGDSGQGSLSLGSVSLVFIHYLQATQM